MNNQTSNKPVILLRIAAILMLLHFIGHTIGMTQGPSHGAEEVAVIEAMKTHHFDVMGSSRSYWDFFLGFGFDASISMLLEAVLFWLLATVARRDPAAAHPFILLFTVAWVARTLLYLKYFFLAPIIFGFLMIALLAAAWATSKQVHRV